MVKEMAEHARGGGVDISGQLLSCGVIDILLSTLSAAEEVGEKLRVVAPATARARRPTLEDSLSL